MGLEAASIPGPLPMANDLTCWISDRSGRFAEGACVPAVCIFSPRTFGGPVKTDNGNKIGARGYFFSLLFQCFINGSWMID